MQNHTGQIIEVLLTEYDWAALIASIGLGSGVPCTLSRIQGESVPQVPRLHDVGPKFKSDTRKHAQAALDSLDALSEKLEALNLSKKQKQELIGCVDSARVSIKSNLNFVLKQFGEYIEKTMTKARTEVSAYAQQMLTRTGLAALLGNTKGPVTYLEEK